MKVPFLLPSCVAALLHGPITFDERSLMIGGERELFLSGAVHYPRVHPSDWDRVFSLAKDMGLNTIQTYVFWNAHEPHLADRGNASWSGWNDLPKFIKKAEEHDLYISLRIGPYVCGEYFFGGIPVWVRELDGIQCFRCADEAWEAEMQRWITDVVEKVRPQLQPRGNIMMLQIENEYGGDQNYLNWAVDMANDLTTDEVVPWNLCHTYKTCFNTNNRNGSYEFRALCTMNGFWMEEYDEDPDQPSPRFIEDLRAKNPGQPAMWTEDQGWFDQWGVAKRIRYSDDQLFGIARWFAMGGSYHNFYMLTGGNNYGLKSGGTVATAYAPDTVISNLLLRHEPRYSYYKKFFDTLVQYKATFLASPIAERQALKTNGTGGGVQRTAVILPCTDTDPAHVGELDASQRWDFDEGVVRANFSGQALCLDALAAVKPLSMVLCDPTVSSQQFVLDTATGHVASVVTGPCQMPASKGQSCHRCLDTGNDGSSLNLWDCKSSSDRSITNQQWSADNERGLRPRGSSESCLSAKIEGGGDVQLHEYGKMAFLSNTASEPLEAEYLSQWFALKPSSVTIVDIEERTIIMSTGDAIDPVNQDPEQVGASTPGSWQVFKETIGYGAMSFTAPSLHEQMNITQNDADYLWYSAPVPSGASDTAHVTVSTQGGSIAYSFLEGGKVSVLSAAMGMANGGDLAKVVKGVTKVEVDGEELSGPWTHSWQLEGDEKQIYFPESTDSVAWEAYGDKHIESPLTWLKTKFDLPEGSTLGDDEVSFVLDLSSMWKGMVYVNGFHLGRYWMEPGTCHGECAPPIKLGHCYMHWKDCDKPTQTLYHIPTDVLKVTDNLVVLFEEGEPQAARDPSAVRFLALTAKGTHIAEAYV